MVDVIKLKAGSTYYNGKPIPSWVFNCTLYYRGKNENGIIFSTLKAGAITGVVKERKVQLNESVNCRVSALLSFECDASN